MAMLASLYALSRSPGKLISATRLVPLLLPTPMFLGLLFGVALSAFWLRQLTSSGQSP